MRASTLLLSFASILCGYLIGCSDSKDAKPQAAAASAAPAVASGNTERVSGPYTHANLAVYLVYGADQAPGKNYLTLQEALEQKKVIVHETGNVNELSIQNVSDDVVYIQSGEIVKGGRQDRTLGTDMLITKSMGNTPISSFCVEHGRWSGRQGEGQSLFGSSSEMVAGKEMKIASNASGGYANQSKVWASVAKAQEKLSENAGAPVQASTSPSSFQLTMENKALTDKTDEYVKALQPAIDGKDDAIGWVYAVNGKIGGGNVYASRELFRKLWPKLIKSGCVEAFAELKKDAAIAPAPSIAAVQTFLADAEKPKPAEKDVNGRTRVASYDCNDSVLLQTDDKESGSWIHRNYMIKEAQPASEKVQPVEPNAPAAQNQRR